jgi:hypothetical protein
MLIQLLNEAALFYASSGIKPTPLFFCLAYATLVAAAAAFAAATILSIIINLTYFNI